MKRILVLVLLMGAVLGAHAQYKDSPIQFTISGNGNASWIFTDSEAISSAGLALGGETEFHIDYFFTPNFAFSTGAIWSFTGGHMEFLDTLPVSFIGGMDILDPGTRLSYHIQYVEVPLGLKMASREIGYSTLFTDFGIVPMWRLKANGDTSDGNHKKDPIFKEVTRFNVAYQAECGLKYSFGNKTCLVIALFYKNTFLDFTTDYLNKPDDNSRINQAGLKLGFGF